MSEVVDWLEERLTQNRRDAIWCVLGLILQTLMWLSLYLVQYAVKPIIQDSPIYVYLFIGNAIGVLILIVFYIISSIWLIGWFFKALKGE